MLNWFFIFKINSLQNHYFHFLHTNLPHSFFSSSHFSSHQRDAHSHDVVQSLTMAPAHERHVVSFVPRHCVRRRRPMLQQIFYLFTSQSNASFSFLKTKAISFTIFTEPPWKLVFNIHSKTVISTKTHMHDGANYVAQGHFAQCWQLGVTQGHFAWQDFARQETILHDEAFCQAKRFSATKVYLRRAMLGKKG